MMDEQRQKEIQKKLEDEERVSRMREGGEEMRAQMEMEELERGKKSDVGSGLSPQEEKRLEAEKYVPHSGLGETQRAEMASWGKEVTHKVTKKVKSIEGSRRAEDLANRTGEIIGKTIRKTVAVAKAMSSGLKDGLNPQRKEKATKPEAMAETATTEVQTTFPQEEKQ